MGGSLEAEIGVRTPERATVGREPDATIESILLAHPRHTKNDAQALVARPATECGETLVAVNVQTPRLERLEAQRHLSTWRSGAWRSFRCGEGVAGGVRAVEDRLKLRRGRREVLATGSSMRR